MTARTATTSLPRKGAIIITLGVIALWNLIGLMCPVLQLSENQNLYIYSSASQVIAGIYGLTVAGYAFLRNQQDRQIDKDESLAEIFERIQTQQHGGVLFITSISGLAILSALSAIALLGVDESFIKTIASNTASALFFSSLSWTAYFVVDAMRPEKILSASESIKQEIASSVTVSQPASVARPRTGGGNLERFLLNYNAIERHLEEYAERHFYVRYKGSIEAVSSQQSSTESDYRGPRARWTKARIVKALASQDLIDPWLADELLVLVKYRNALVHGRDMTVEDAMVLRVEKARETLGLKLTIEYQSDVRSQT